MQITESLLRARLELAFAGARIEITDESEMHRGHAGWREGGGTHFRLRIVAAEFAGLGRIARQRRVHDALAEELAGTLHALSVRALAPDEETPAG